MCGSLKLFILFHCKEFICISFVNAVIQIFVFSHSQLCCLAFLENLDLFSIHLLLAITSHPVGEHTRPACRTGLQDSQPSLSPIQPAGPFGSQDGPGQRRERRRRLLCFESFKGSGQHSESLSRLVRKVRPICFFYLKFCRYVSL